jgi:hypothetical protein
MNSFGKGNEEDVEKGNILNPAFDTGIDDGLFFC